MIADFEANTGDNSYRFVHRFFEDQAAQTPDNIAVVKGNKQLDYHTLNEMSNTLAAVIIGQNTNLPFVAISTTRSVEMVISVLAILKAGKAYLPLDPNFPQERLRQQIKDSGVQFCLSNEKEAAFFEQLGLQIIQPKEKTTIKTANTKHGDLAYLLYTSGSTGAPKGVCMGHAPMVNLIRWQKKQSVCSSKSKTLQFTPLSFDVSFQEVFATFSTGGTLVLIDDEDRLDPDKLLQYIDQQQINRYFCLS